MKNYEYRYDKYIYKDKDKDKDYYNTCAQGGNCRYNTNSSFSNHPFSYAIDICPLGKPGSKGDKGDQGAPGKQGPRGPRGATGTYKDIPVAYGTFRHDPAYGNIPANSNIRFHFVVGEYKNLGFTVGGSDIKILYHGVYRLEYIIEPSCNYEQTFTLRINGKDVNHSNRYNEIAGRNNDINMHAYVTLKAGDIITLHTNKELYLSTKDPVAILSIAKFLL